MTVIALAFALLIVVLGTIGLFSPSAAIRVAQHFQTPAGLYFAAALRLAMGVTLILAAPASRATDVLRILGTVIIVAGVATPFIGLERSRRVVNWWSTKGPVLIRSQGAFAIALGLLLAYALVL